MNLIVAFTLDIKDFKSIDKPNIKHLADKYNCSVSINEGDTNNLWLSRYTMLVDCPDDTSINAIVKDLYSLFGGNFWSVSVKLDNPDNLVSTTQTTEKNEDDYLTVEKISCHGTVGPLQDDLKFLSKELKKYYDSSNVVKIEGFRQIPIDMMADKPQTHLNYNIFIDY